MSPAPWALSPHPRSARPPYLPLSRPARAQWGAAQLVGHPLIRPKSIHNPDILEAYARDYMYLGCVAFVKQVCCRAPPPPEGGGAGYPPSFPSSPRPVLTPPSPGQVKKGPLHETSPVLNDISGVPNWAKVNTGLMKMYQVEVMSKFPIMQHFMFGSLLRYATD